MGRFETLAKLNRKLKSGKATEPEKRRFRVLLREEAKSRKAQAIFSKLPQKR